MALEQLKSITLSKGRAIPQLPAYAVRDILIATLFFLMLLVIAFISARKHFQLQSLPAEQFYHFVEQKHPVIIDVRESAEILQSPFSYEPLVHWPFLQLVEQTATLSLDPAQNYLIVCSDGNRARLIAAFLLERDLNIPYLDGGLMELQKNASR